MQTRNLNSSTDPLTILANIGSDWIWQTDADQRLTYLSPRFSEVLGLSIPDWLGRSRTEFARADYDTDKWKNHLADLAARRAFRNFQTTIVDARGAVRPILVSGSPLFDEQGAFLGYVGVGHDVTELRAREQQAESHAEELRVTLQSIEQGVIRFDATLRIRTSNGKIGEWFGIDSSRGLSIGEFLANLNLQVMPGKSTTPGPAFDRLSSIRSGEPYLTEFRLASGRACRESYVPLHRGGGVLTYTDVTDLRQQQAREKALSAQIHEERTKLLEAQTIAKIGNWETDLTTGAGYWSPETYRIFEFSPKEFQPSYDAFVQLVHPEDRAALTQAVGAAIESRQVSVFEHRVITKTGQEKIIIERWKVTTNDFGEPQRAIGTCQDVTELRNAEAKAAEATTLLKVAGRAARLGGWIADVRTGEVTWSEVTAEIHEFPTKRHLSVDEGINYYAPEFRDRIRALFSSCVQTGAPFDEMLQLLTARGHRIWVRTIGEAVRDPSGAVVAVHGAFQDLSELVAAREESRRLTEKLIVTLDAISEAFMTIDAESCFTFVNRAALRLLRSKEEDLLGSPISDIFLKLVGPAFEEECRRAREQKTSRHFESYSPRLRIWISVRIYASPDGLAIYMQDVTLQRSQREHLRLLEAAIEKLNDVITITDAGLLAEEGPKIVYVNDAFCRSTGYRREDVIGKATRFLHGPKTDPVQVERIRRSVGLARSVMGEILNYTKNGRECWVKLDVVPIVDAANRVTHFVSVEHDITEQRRSELALAQSEQRFRTVAQLGADLVWDWDIVSKTIWRHGAGAARFGLAANEEVRHDDIWEARIHVEDRGRVLSSLSEATLNGESTWSNEFRLLRVDGDYATVVAKSAIERGDNGVATRMLGSVEDVTERRAFEQRAVDAQRLESVGKLTGGVAHDFNNILMVIQGNVENILDSEGGDVDVRPHLERIGRASERAAQLTRQLLAFSRKQQLYLKDVDLNGLVVETGALLRRTLGAHIEIEAVLAEDLWLTHTDRAQVEAALVNLAINARDAMPEGGRLTINTRNARIARDDTPDPELVPGEYVVLSVSDAGCGMPPEVQARAFEPFFTTKEVGRGTGLGLSMVYGFVKQSQGHITIESELSKGTTVAIYLKRSSLPADDQEAQSREKLPGGTERLLVVEDEEAVRETVVRQLRSLGYHVEDSPSGVEALPLLERREYDLLLTDLVMPGPLNGGQLVTRAREKNARLRFVFMSGYAEELLSRHEKVADIILLSKPFAKGDLARAIRAALDAPDSSTPQPG